MSPSPSFRPGAVSRCILVSLCLIAGGVLTVNQTIADEWPRWMGPQRDGVWRESGIVDRLPELGERVVWRHKLGGGYAGPAVAHGAVFVMDRSDDPKGASVENNIRDAGKLTGKERVLCLDETTGKPRWTHSYDCEYTIAYPTGPRCTPTVDGDRVYTLGAMGDLLCLQAADGKVLWRKKLTEQYQTRPPLWGFASHPRVDGDHLLVPTGGRGSGVVAFNKHTGKEIWKAVTTKDVGYAPLVIYEPADAARQLIFWHSDGITSLNPANGDVYWNVKFPYQPNPSQTTIATPRIIGDKLLISEYYKGSLLLKLKADPPGVEELWRSHDNDPRHKTSLNSMMTTPVVDEGYVYGIGYDARGRGLLRCIELDSGKLQWSEEKWMEDEGVLFATSFLVRNEDRYFMFNDNGELMIAKLSPDGFEPISRTKLLKPSSVARGREVVWSHPAYANRRIYARNDEEIICVDLAK